MQLIEFSDEDFQSLYAVMQPLWKETYGNILPLSQIEFLLQKYFSKDGIRHFRDNGYQYYKIDEEGKKIGTLVFVERETETYIDKLYLAPDSRGKGYAAFVFEELVKRGKDLLLNVNQSNARAVHCYLKNGFVVEEKIDIDLGNGMVNCDYVMRKKV